MRYPRSSVLQAHLYNMCHTTRHSAAVPHFRLSGGHSVYHLHKLFILFFFFPSLPFSFPSSLPPSLPNVFLIFQLCRQAVGKFSLFVHLVLQVFQDSGEDELIINESLMPTCYISAVLLQPCLEAEQAELWCSVGQVVHTALVGANGSCKPWETVRVYFTSNVTHHYDLIVSIPQYSGNRCLCQL